MEYDLNIYKHPEKHGFKIVADLEDSDECYFFDTHVVFKDIDTGKLYYAHSSGCSCPTPFEEFDSLDDMELIDKEGFDSFCKSIYNLQYSHSTLAEKKAFLDDVKANLAM